MPVHHHRYGKERIRVTALDRSVSPHRLSLCSVDISLEGDFDDSYTAGDNRSVIATDSMKNTVYVLAREVGVDSVERFASLLAEHFTQSYGAVRKSSVVVSREVWSPIMISGEPAETALVRTGAELDFATALGDDRGVTLTSGFDGVQVIKTADSGFSGFFRDRFATLVDTEDRLFATTIRAEWSLGTPIAAPDPEDDEQRRARLRSSLLITFAKHRSRSVQETLYAMASAALEELKDIEEITLQLPNQHHHVVDLSPFGLDNANQIFVATDEPFGSIEATVRRS